MKTFYTPARRIILAFFFAIIFQTTKAQHVPGDIAFTGYHSQGTDMFSFVLLKNFTAGQTIRFTDNAWLSTNVFRTGEGDILWTVPAGGLIAGKEVLINCATNTASLYGAGNAGTVSGTNLNFNTSGDQVFAYTGSLAAPTAVIAGLNMNVLCATTPFFDCYTTDDIAWDGACSNNSTSSMKPSGGGNLNLTTGVDALWIGFVNPGPPGTVTEWDNARFNCSSVSAATLSTVAGIRAAVNNKNNWTTNNDLTPSVTFPLPAGCLWLGLLPAPVHLTSFTGKLNSDKTVTLQWKVEEQKDMQEYIVEESSNGTDFIAAGTLAAVNADAYTYHFIDRQVAAGNNYYRIRTVELTGKITYSDVIVINLKKGIKANVFPNPVIDKLTIRQFENTRNTTAVLSDGQGRVLQHIQFNGFEHAIDMSKYAAGLYTLKMEDGTVFKIIKQ